MEKNVYHSNLKISYLSSIVIFILMILSSILGITNPTVFYPASQQIGNLVTDWTNLLLITPIFLIILRMVSKESVIALLLLPGIILYMVFIYFFYSIYFLIGYLFFSISLKMSLILYFILAILSIMTYIELCRSINHEEIAKRYTSQVPPILVGVILLVFGIGFLLLDIGNMITLFTQSSQTPPNLLDEIVPWIVDFTVGIPIAIFAGIMILMKRNVGYTLSPGLLFYFGLLDFGITILYVFYWIYDHPDFNVIALITFTIVAAVCFFPLSYFFGKPKNK